MRKDGDGSTFHVPRFMIFMADEIKPVTRERQVKTTEEIKEETPQIEEVIENEEKKAEEPTEAELKKKKKKIKRQISKGQAHIKCTYNNTMVMISDMNGAMLGWSSSGLLGFKGAKKATPYAATQVVSRIRLSLWTYFYHAHPERTDDEQ